PAQNGSASNSECPLDPWGDPDCDAGFGGPEHLVFVKGWDATGEGYATGEELAVKCPPNGTLGPVFGTNPYEASSSICTAAVHAGQITRAEGGIVGAKIVTPSGPLDGGSANGVTSDPAGNPRGAFEIL